MKQIIQGLWIGSELSMMEQLSIASFLKNGHDYHLYVYGDVKGKKPLSRDRSSDGRAYARR